MLLVLKAVKHRYQRTVVNVRRRAFGELEYHLLNESVDPHDLLTERRGHARAAVIGCRTLILWNNCVTAGHPVSHC
jgi:hypothetical protein